MNTFENVNNISGLSILLITSLMGVGLVFTETVNIPLDNGMAYREAVFSCQGISDIPEYRLNSSDFSEKIFKIFRKKRMRSPSALNLEA